jgi:hypothetical protein
MKSKDELIKDLNKSRQAYHDGMDRYSTCPICGRSFRFDQCPHNISEAEDRLFENYVGALVRLELLKIA